MAASCTAGVSLLRVRHLCKKAALATRVSVELVHTLSWHVAIVRSVLASASEFVLSQLRLGRASIARPDHVPAIERANPVHRTARQPLLRALLLLLSGHDNRLRLGR